MTDFFLAASTTGQLNALSNTSVISPPPGMKQDFMSPRNPTGPFYVITGLLLGIMTVVVLNRVYTKTVLVRKYSWDDATIMLGVFGTTGYYAATVLGFQKAVAGVHPWDIPVPKTVSLSNLPESFIALLAPPTMLFVKNTFFIMYFQLFRPMRWLRVCVYIGGLFTTAFYIGVTIAELVFLIPRRGEFMISPGYKQVYATMIPLYITLPAVGFVIDACILVLPIVAVNRLHLQPRQKVGVTLTLMFGVSACGASLLNLYYRNVLNKSRDMSCDVTTVKTTILVEMLVGIICACIPAVAHTCRHLPRFDVLSRLYARLSILTSASGRSNDQPFSVSKMRNRPGDDPHRHKYDQIPDTDCIGVASSELHQLEMAHMKSNCAFVPGRERNMAKGGIYFSIEFEQNSRQVSRS